jgi:hypothetical protein
MLMQERINGEDNRSAAHTARLRGRPFRPGESGNPAGKAKGTRNRVAMLLEVLMEGEAEEIGRKAIELAKKGDGAALKACLDRLLPKRDRIVPFELPPIEKAGDLPKASAAIIAAVAAGEITPSEASDLARLVDTHIRAIELDELEKELGLNDDEKEKFR